MPNIQFGSTTVDVPEELLSNPEALKNIAEQVKFTANQDTDTGAGWKERLAINSVEKPEDKVQALRSKGFDAAMTPQGVAFIDPKTNRPTLADEKGFSAKDLLDVVPEITEGIGATAGGILGGGLGLAAGPAAVGTAMLGSAAGGTAGRELAQGAMRYFTDTADTRSGLERLTDAGKTAMLNAGGELAGQALGQGVKAARMAFTPGAESQAVKATADAIGLRPTLSTVADSRVGRLVEDVAINSRLGRPGMERAVQQQNDALGQELNALTATGDTGWRQAARLHVAPDVVEESSRVSREIPVGEPLGPVSGGWHDIHNQLISASSPEQRRVFARQALQRLGGKAPESFNAGAFLQNWERADPRFKHALGSVEGVGKELNALLPLVRRTAELQSRSKKPLDTPAGSLLQLLGVGGGYVGGGALGAGAVALAPALVGKLLTSPRFVNWLSKVPSNPGALSRHLGRLAVMAQDDPDVSAFAGALGGR